VLPLDILRPSVASGVLYTWKHDVGLENSSNTSPIVRPRYRTTWLTFSIRSAWETLTDALALVEEDLHREGAGEDRTNGLQMNLAYLHHMRTEHAASEHLKPST